MKQIPIRKGLSHPSFMTLFAGSLPRGIFLGSVLTKRALITIPPRSAGFIAPAVDRLICSERPMGSGRVRTQLKVESCFDTSMGQERRSAGGSRWPCGALQLRKQTGVGVNAHTPLGPQVQSRGFNQGNRINRSETGWY